MMGGELNEDKEITIVPLSCTNVEAQMAEKVDKLVLSQEIFTRHFSVAKTRNELTQEEQDVREAWNTARAEFVKNFRHLLDEIPYTWLYKNQEAIVSSSILPAK
jgi:hypothetical protein